MNISDLTIRAAAEGLAARAFSSVELTQAVLDAAAAKDSDLGAYLTFDAEGALAQAAEADAARAIVDENPAGYPTPYHVFNSMLPAYGFYLRHADGIRFENVRLRVLDPDERRPPVVADDATYTTVACAF